MPTMDREDPAARAGSPTDDLRQRVLHCGRSILETEGRAVLSKARTLDDGFVRLAQRLLDLRGHVAITGVGKSGLIGMKIAATLSSTGTPSLFLSPVDAMHGDLGVLREGDVLIAISNSGETAEILAVVSAARTLGVDVVGFTGEPGSSLARDASIVVNTGVEREACPLGLAPTTSTTVMLAMGDALAMALLEERHFTREHYARFHPGGSLGQRLRYRVRDVMRTGDLLPVVATTDTLERALQEMTGKENLGLTLVVEPDDGVLAGILTDGDLRRLLLATLPSGGGDPSSTPVGDVMTPAPRTVDAEESAADALQTMEAVGITSLAVIDHRGRPAGVIHLHDILGRGKVVL